jgi:translation initiation factor IF-3
LEDNNLAKNRNQNKRNSNNRVYFNHGIKASKVRCIDQNEENIGVILKSRAIAMAEEVELDLVQVSPFRVDSIPTCKIVDYGRYKYELSKRQKIQAKKQRESAIKTKEIKFRPSTDINDLRTKANKARKFIEEGCRVKVAVYFKGRELQHKHLGPAKLDLFLDLLELDLHKFDEPKFEGRVMSIMIAASKANPPIEKVS